MDRILNSEEEIKLLTATLREQQSINETNNSILQLLKETSKAITSEVELEKLVQRITDKATEVSGAQFGAFFYNVEKEQKEYLLYSISGVPREKFSHFPLPRATKIFGPTFEGKGTVRYDDVTEQANFGKNPPYTGMPEGHLPVRSYLAVPVISPITQVVIGGLFLGHSTAGIFTDKEEKLVEGIAMQGAIAMGNARLFEEKNHAETLLREQRELYLNILNSSFDSILILSDEGKIVEVNEITSDLFGQPRGEISEKNIKELLFFFDPRFLNTKQLREGGPINFHTQGLKSNGKIVDIECRARVFTYCNSPHILVMLRDITEQIKTENDLKKSRKFSELITEASPVVLWLTNDAGELHYVNSLWSKWTGADTNAHYGFGWLNFIHEDDRDEVRKDFKRAFEKKQLLDLDFRVVSQDNGQRWVNMKAEPFSSFDNFFSGMAGSVSDITEKKIIQMELSESDKRAKETLEKQVQERTAELGEINDELLQFTRIASHDLKEPIRKISIFSKMLYDSVQNYGKEQDIKRLENIIHSSDRMMKLIDDLLSLSRLSHQERGFETVDLHNTVTVVLDDLQFTLETKNVEVIVGKLPLVEGIPLQLGQIFLNLFTNSIKFSDPTRKLVLQLHSEEIDRTSFKLVYTDTGIGFNNKFAEKIFNVFQRLHSRDQYEGTGVGLSIVKKIVLQHTGRIVATGQEGVGAKFEIILPYKQTAREN